MSSHEVQENALPTLFLFAMVWTAPQPHVKTETQTAQIDFNQKNFYHPQVMSMQAHQAAKEQDIEDVSQCLQGNLCRCTGQGLAHQNLLILIKGE